MEGYMGSHINAAIVSDDKMNAFMNKCKEIMEKYGKLYTKYADWKIDGFTRR